MSAGPRPEKFNIAINDHGRKQKCGSCVLVGKINFTDHHTPDTKNGFRDSVLVCKMCDYYCTIRKNFEHLRSCRPSHQAKQVISMIRLDENKPLQNAFKCI